MKRARIISCAICVAILTTQLFAQSVDQKVKSIRDAYAAADTALKNKELQQVDINFDARESAPNGNPGTLSLIYSTSESVLRKVIRDYGMETVAMHQEYLYDTSGVLIFSYEKQNVVLEKELTERRYYFSNGSLIRYMESVTAKGVKKDSTKDGSFTLDLIESAKERLTTAATYIDYFNVVIDCP
jgi:hypothetical protein